MRLFTFALLCVLTPSVAFADVPATLRFFYEAPTTAALVTKRVTPASCKAYVAGTRTSKALAARCKPKLLKKDVRVRMRVIRQGGKKQFVGTIGVKTAALVQARAGNSSNVFTIPASGNSANVGIQFIPPAGSSFQSAKFELLDSENKSFPGLRPFENYHPFSAFGDDSTGIRRANFALGLYRVSVWVCTKKNGENPCTQTVEEFEFSVGTPIQPDPDPDPNPDPEPTPTNTPMPQSEVITIDPGTFENAPPLRDLVSLAGTWTMTVNGTNSSVVVPDYVGTDDLNVRSYSRSVTVPSSFNGRKLRLYFENLAVKSRVYVNGTKVFDDFSAFKPFEVDVSSLVQAGSSFNLRVDLEDARHLPGADYYNMTNGAKVITSVRYPVGGLISDGSGLKAGIMGAVELRAYGVPVSIEDAFVTTEVTPQKVIRVAYTLTNHSASSKSVILRGDIHLAGQATIAKTLRQAVTLAANEKRVVTLDSTWPTAQLYTPDSPVLYHLQSSILENFVLRDESVVRFGFKEVKIDGRNFLLNGVRFNPQGSYETLGDDYYTPKEMFTLATFPATAEALRDMGIDVLRHHHHPLPNAFLDIAAQKGLFIANDAPLWARQYFNCRDKSNNDQIIRCSSSHYAQLAAELADQYRAWVPTVRNNPAVFEYITANEARTFGDPDIFTEAQIDQLASVLTSLDPSRPVVAEGDATFGSRMWNQQVVSFHYPEGYDCTPDGWGRYSWCGSMVKWANDFGYGRYLAQNDARPVVVGEMLHTKSWGPLPGCNWAGLSDTAKRENYRSDEVNKWWIPVVVRGMRAKGWTDIRPQMTGFGLVDLGYRAARREDGQASWEHDQCESYEPKRGELLKNSLASIAIFDETYDRLGVSPFITENRNTNRAVTNTGVFPSLQAGGSVQRTLNLFNDSLQSANLDVQIVLKVGTNTVDSISQSFFVEAGQMKPLTLGLTVPGISSQRISLTRIVRRNGTEAFREESFFTTQGSSSTTGSLNSLNAN